MKVLVMVAALAFGVLGGAPPPAAAGEVLKPGVLAPNPFAMTPPPAPLEPRRAAPVPANPLPHRPPRAAPLVVYPCCPTGHWAYQWVPTPYTAYVWVPGYVTADGSLVGDGYQLRVVNAGYYQPVWVSE
jgi:hypothetical protein